MKCLRLDVLSVADGGKCPWMPFKEIKPLKSHTHTHTINNGSPKREGLTSVVLEQDMG